MENYDNSNVKRILSELESIITHAEKAIPSIEEGNNERLEQINFEQLTRETESKINMLRSEVDTLTDIEIMKAAAENMQYLQQKFKKLDVEVISTINEKLMLTSAQLEKEIKRHDSRNANRDNFEYINPKKQSEHGLLDIIISICDLGVDYCTDVLLSNAKNKLDNIVKFKERFEQITGQFRTVFRKLRKINTNLLEKIDQQTEVYIANLIVEKKKSNKGRKKEKWWGGNWENLTEQEVEQRLKQAYDATNSLLSDLKEEKNIDTNKSRNAVWAAVYFYAAETVNLVNPNKGANNISFIGDKENPRGLYKIGVNCSKNTVNNYYIIIKGFLKATIEIDSSSPHINQLIRIIKEEKDTEEYPSTRKWLSNSKNFSEITKELGGKVKYSENIVMFIAKNLPILRSTFYKVHPTLSR